MNNLDALCARTGYRLGEAAGSSFAPLNKTKRNQLEGVITDTLGVLQSQGLYAAFLFIKYQQRSSDGPRLEAQWANRIQNVCLELLRHDDVALLPPEHSRQPATPSPQSQRQQQQADTDPHFRALAELAEDLDKLMLASQLLGQTLTYARYHVRSLPIETGAGQQAGP